MLNAKVPVGRPLTAVYVFTVVGVPTRSMLIRRRVPRFCYEIRKPVYVRPKTRWRSQWTVGNCQFPGSNTGVRNYVFVTIYSAGRALPTVYGIFLYRHT